MENFKLGRKTAVILIGAFAAILGALGFDTALLTAYAILAQLIEAFWMGTFALTAVFHSGLSFGQMVSSEENKKRLGDWEIGD